MSEENNGSDSGISRFQESWAGETGRCRATDSDKGDKIVQATRTDSDLLIRRLETTLLSLADVDEIRVQEIRKKLACGSFRIDSALTAKNLLRFEKDLD